MHHLNVETILRTLDDVGASFSESAKKRMIERNYHRDVLILKTILPYIYRRKISRVLDIGIGSGVVSLVLRKVGFDVVGMDNWIEYSSEYDNISGTREDIVKRLQNAGIELVLCNVEKERIPSQDESFDIVLLLDVIEHLHCPPIRILREAKRVLKMDGLLVIATPNAANLRNRIHMLLGKSVNPIFNDFKTWVRSNDSGYFGHRREYILDELTFMCKFLGFHVKHVELSNCYQLSTPIKGTDFYVRDFKLNSLNQFIKAIYLLVTLVFRNLRYFIILVVEN